MLINNKTAYMEKTFFLSYIAEITISDNGYRHRGDCHGGDILSNTLQSIIKEENNFLAITFTFFDYFSIILLVLFTFESFLVVF